MQNTCVRPQAFADANACKMARHPDGHFYPGLKSGATASQTHNSRLILAIQMVNSIYLLI
eukprot:487630-Pelagomonas_calceolata.AAC.2